MCLQFSVSVNENKFKPFKGLSSYYSKLYTFASPSVASCSHEVLNNLRLAQFKNTSNAFRFDNGSCEIGKVSPLYGSLENNPPLPKGPKSGHLLLGCLGNCKFFILINLIILHSLFLVQFQWHTLKNLLNNWEKFKLLKFKIVKNDLNC